MHRVGRWRGFARTSQRRLAIVRALASLLDAIERPRDGAEADEQKQEALLPGLLPEQWFLGVAALDRVAPLRPEAGALLHAFLVGVGDVVRVDVPDRGVLERFEAALDRGNEEPDH